MYERKEIIKYVKLKYDNFDHMKLFLNIDQVEESIDFNIFKENRIIEVNYDDGFFSSLDVNRFDNKLLLEFIRLGDFDGYYKDWSYKKYMDSLKKVCESFENVWVSTYDISTDDPLCRSFFLSMLVDLDNYTDFNQIYEECSYLCRTLINVTENRLKGLWWVSDFETNEILFHKLFLQPYFYNMGFERVIYNHGNKEFGKDFILQTTNILREKEYYGVQAKAGNISGAANSDIRTIINQINDGFSVPYVLIDRNEVYMSKIIIAISGVLTDNAREIIYREMNDRYKLSNLVFLSKKEISSITISL